MWLGTLDPPARLRVLIEKNVISLNRFDEHPLGTALISHAENASSLRDTLPHSSPAATGKALAISPE
jgi:hypothetical protein